MSPRHTLTEATITDALGASERLGRTLHFLIVGKGRIKERLLDASTRAFIHVNRSALPEGDARDLFDKIKSTISLGQDDSPRAIAASIDQMTEDEACDVAHTMEALDAMVRFHLEDGALRTPSAAVSSHPDLSLARKPRP